MEILYRNNIRCLRQVGRDFGIRGMTKMSKLDIIKLIRHNIVKDDYKFNRVFSKLQGSSGVFDDLPTWHGVRANVSYTC